MKTRYAAALLLAILCSPGLVFAQAADRNSPDRKCDRCSDLCSLLDQYWQKERGIEVWNRYASSNTSRVQIPVDQVRNLNRFYKQIYEKELPAAWENRPLPCEAVKEWEKEPPRPPMDWPSGTGLETTFGESCAVSYRGAPLTGDNEKAWRSTHVCKGSADAELEHEKVHQEHCSKIWKQNKYVAATRLQMVHNVAETEMRAWIKHRDMLKDEIRMLARNCGWEPTDRQRSDPNSVPSEKQAQKMEKQGWNAFKALRGKSK
jgi:hypothetical protein